MGQLIEQTTFSALDYQRFRERLRDNLESLRHLLAQPGFGVGPATFGAELELYVLDGNGHPLHRNLEIQQLVNDPHLAVELNRFNLEYNLLPVCAKGRPFSALQVQIETMLQRLQRCAATLDANILPIGILPTLKASDMGAHAITDIPRYRVLNDALLARRGGAFHIAIEGEERLELDWGDVSLEGANTSFQFHYRLNPERFADAFNTLQLITPLTVALAANSPLFLGKMLWHETRIALFKQSIDSRLAHQQLVRPPSRVLFGEGWLRKDVHELFSQGVYLFEPLLPIYQDDPLSLAGHAPALAELRLHQGSIWAWNRPIYDPTDGGHVRIEIRSLPAGPSIQDMLACSALTVGLIEGLCPQINQLLPGIPFRYAESNFYRAAKDGLNARLFWPDLQNTSLKERPVSEILNELLPLAHQGLAGLGVEADDIDRYLNLCQQNLAHHINGALWQRQRFEILKAKMPTSRALTQLVSEYQAYFRSGEPVYRWSGLSRPKRAHSATFSI